MGGELDRLQVPGCLKGPLADQCTTVERFRLGNREDNHRVVLNIEEVCGAQMVVPLLVLRGQGSRIERHAHG